MPRTIEVTVPLGQTDALISRVKGLTGVVGLSVQYGSSLLPPGDVLTLQTTNDAARTVVQLLSELGMMESGVTISKPQSLISQAYVKQIDHEGDETVWEELALFLREQSNLATNFLWLMFLSGCVAAVGVWADQLALIYAAQLLAPHVEPLLRLPLGLLSGRTSTAVRGSLAGFVGYGLLLAGSAVTFLVLRALDPATPAALTKHSLVHLYTAVTPSSVLVALLAGLASGFVLASQRAVLLSGVYLALALVPGMSLVGMALAAGDFTLAGRALIVWAIPAASVVVLGGSVLTFKRFFRDRRPVLE